MQLQILLNTLPGPGQDIKFWWMLEHDAASQLNLAEHTGSQGQK